MILWRERLPRLPMVSRSVPGQFYSLSSSTPLSAGVRRDHARWLPEHEAPPVPGSAVLFLNRVDGLWYWEGASVVPGN